MLLGLRFVLLALLVLVVAAFFAARPSEAQEEQQQSGGEGYVIAASYYGFELAGSPTASGVPFDPYGYTAAHRSLPLGTCLVVCYEACVKVVVYDRGPYVGGRDLDVSYGAAKAIGLVPVGVAAVRVRMLGTPYY